MVQNFSRVSWPDGQRAAVTLSYDDGIPCHFETVMPALEAAGLRGTFYVPVYSGIVNYAGQWRNMVARGHELGNHSLFHPCRGGSQRAWLDPVYDLRFYNERRWMEEMTVANYVLNQIDGRTERTYGNNCFDIYIGPEDNLIPLEPMVSRLFTAARGELTSQPVNLSALDFCNLGTVEADYRTFADLKAEIEKVVESGGWIIYTMHGVGKTHNLFIEEDEHAQLVKWLGQNADRIWTAPLIEVVRHLKKD